MGNKNIPLNAFLKIKGVVDTGGQAKIVIRSGEVFVNSEKETRVTKKLKPGDVVKIEDYEFKVTEDIIE